MILLVRNQNSNSTWLLVPPSLFNPMHVDICNVMQGWLVFAFAFNYYLNLLWACDQSIFYDGSAQIPITSKGNATPLHDHTMIQPPSSTSSNVLCSYVLAKNRVGFAAWGVHCDNIRKQRAGKYRVIYIHKRKNLEFS